MPAFCPSQAPRSPTPPPSPSPPLPDGWVGVWEKMKCGNALSSLTVLSHADVGRLDWILDGKTSYGEGGA